MCTFAPVKQFAIYILTLLVLTMGCTTEAERKQMRSGLDSINARNRTDQPFTVQEVEPYVRFFDDHGTADDRLLAHYLLGRAYYDHGEAPMALQCYHDAIDCADTTSCDLKQLSRVYGQMALVFYYQGLYRQELQYEQMSVKYAWKGKDTLLALMNYEQESFAYNKLGMQDSAIYVIEDVASKYQQFGYPQNAAISLGTIIRTLTDRGEYQKAKAYMDVYESKSGLFDDNGNIAHGREVYYNIKGTYYLYINKLDSAEYYFRKELKDGKDFNNQNGAAIGLAKLYELRHVPDSASKYFHYAYEMNDSAFAQTATATVEQMQAMYDYSRHQEIAQQEKERASEERNIRLLTAALLVLIVLITTGIISSLYFKRRKEQRLYAMNLDSLEKAQSEVLKLREYENAFVELIAEKETEIEHLTAKLIEKNKIVRQDHATAMEQICQSDIYKDLKEREKSYKPLTKEQLRKLRLLIIEKIPDFNGKLLEKQYRLNETDFNVCILLRLGIKSKEISTLLKISQPRVSQICSKVLDKVFGKTDGGVNDLIILLCKYY